MLHKLKDFFAVHMQMAEGEDVNEHRLHLAAAALLVEIARADFQVDAVEEATISDLLVNTLDLAGHEVDELISLAHQESREAVALHPFTILINENYSNAQKLRLMTQLWRVAFADGRIDKYEEHMIRKIADLIYVSHKDFIRCKHEAELQHRG